MFDGSRDITRIKGPEQNDLTKPHLIIHRQKNDQIELLKNGVVGQAGDRAVRVEWPTVGDRDGV